MVSDNITQQFKKFVREDLNQVLTDKEAADIMTGLVGCIDTLARIHHGQITGVEHYQQIEKGNYGSRKNEGKHGTYS